MWVGGGGWRVAEVCQVACHRLARELADPTRPALTPPRLTPPGAPQPPQRGAGAAAVCGPDCGGQRHRHLRPPHLVQRLLAATGPPGGCLGVLRAGGAGWVDQGTYSYCVAHSQRVQSELRVPLQLLTVPPATTPTHRHTHTTHTPQLPVNDTLTEVTLHFELSSMTALKYMIMSQVWWVWWGVRAACVCVQGGSRAAARPCLVRPAARMSAVDGHCWPGPHPPYLHPRLLPQMEQSFSMQKHWGAMADGESDEVRRRRRGGVCCSVAVPAPACACLRHNNHPPTHPASPTPPSCRR